MADNWQSIGELAETPASTDDVLLRDISDTTDNAAGTVKRVSRTNLLGGVYVSGGTDVPVLDGGTGASDVAGARSNLGLVIGTDVQAWDADLDGLAAGTAASAIDMNGLAVTGNLAEVITRGAATSQPTVADSGAWIVTDGAITIPNTAGFHCTLEFGGDHDVTHNSIVWNTGAAVGDVVSVMVKPGNAIRITPKIAAADVITEADFA